jgi:TfoX/Sxy family transcriptional regulator of competence genes
MASRADTLQYVIDQLAGLAGITTRKMFGEFAIYLDGKVVGFICDDQLFLKPTDAGTRLLESPQFASPWVGAKPHLLITDELEQRDLLSRLVQATANALPLPKPKPAKAVKSLAAPNASAKESVRKPAKKAAKKTAKR